MLRAINGIHGEGIFTVDMPYVNDRRAQRQRVLEYKPDVRSLTYVEVDLDQP